MPVALSFAPGEPSLLSICRADDDFPPAWGTFPGVDVGRNRRDPLGLDGQLDLLPGKRCQAYPVHVFDRCRGDAEIAVLEDREGVLAAHHDRIAPGSGDDAQRAALFQAAVNRLVLLRVEEGEVFRHELPLDQLTVQEHDHPVLVQRLQLCQRACQRQRGAHFAAQGERAGVCFVALPTHNKAHLPVRPVDTVELRRVRLPAELSHNPGEVIRRLVVECRPHTTVGQVHAQASQVLGSAFR